MPGWRLREFHPDDLDGILRLWEQTHGEGNEPVYALSEVLASCQKVMPWRPRSTEAVAKAR